MNDEASMTVECTTEAAEQKHASRMDGECIELGQVSKETQGGLGIGFDVGSWRRAQ
jgi:hypothetical protein